MPTNSNLLIIQFFMFVFLCTEGRPRVKLDNSINELYKEYVSAFLFTVKEILHSFDPS